MANKEQEMIEPSLITYEGCDCQICGMPIMPGEHVQIVCLDPFADGGGEFATCCGKVCALHAIEDHGARVANELGCRGK